MKLTILLLCLCIFPLKASALEIEAPTISPEYRDQMPENTASLQEGLADLVKKAVMAVRPDIREAARISGGIMAAVLLGSMVQTVSSSAQKTGETACIVVIAATMLTSANAMIHLAADTVGEMGNYGKLLLPVMTAALAAQGGVTSSGAIYAGTAFFSALLQSAMDSFLVPGIWLFLALRCAGAVTGEDLLKRTGDLLKQFLSWCLKLLLTVFTTYLSLTHVISGATDAAALKAAKVSMSSFVPVVGGILSDASEAVLVSAGVLKNAAGLYGILAVLALFLQPFLRIGLQYLLLKITAALCSVYASTRVTGILDSFSTAMGLLLGMTAAGCSMVLISTVCFMKGVS